MTTLKYKIIKSKTQYNDYCNKLEKLLSTISKSREINDEIEILTLLIGKWDDEHNTFNEADPIQLLHSLMNDHNLKPKDLVKILKISKGYVSDILNYKKGLSKEVIRTLATRFKVRQEAFNRNYELKPTVNSRLHRLGAVSRGRKVAV